MVFSFLEIADVNTFFSLDRGLLASFCLLLLGCVATLPMTSQTVALAPQSNHGEILSLPTQGEIVIDGKLDDEGWDKSGEMFVYNVVTIRDRYSVKVYANWDKNFLYLGMAFRDPSPMMNKVNPNVAIDQGWQADSTQLRILTDQGETHITAWYGSDHDTTATHFHFGRPAANQYAPPIQVLNPGTSAQKGGYKIAYSVDTDKRGYVQEMRIPWQMIVKNTGKIGPDYEFGFSGEYFWGGPAAQKWPKVLYSDPINQERPIRVLLYNNPPSWGRMKLLAEGNLPPKVEDQPIQRFQGPVTINLNVPEDAVKISLVVEDTQGRRVRNLLANDDVKPFIVGEANGQLQLEIPWDGRENVQFPGAEYDNKRRILTGDVVSPGKYVVRGLVHNGLGVAHSTSFYNPGNPPWQDGQGGGGWGGDHAPFTIITTAPSDATYKGRVFLAGSPQAPETGSPFIGLDATGQKIWEKTEQGESTATAFAAGKTHLFAAQDVLRKVDPDTGVYIPFGTGIFEKPLPARATGMAIVGNKIAVAFADQNGVAMFNQSDGKLSGRVRVQAPTHLFAIDDKTIAGVSAGRLFKVQGNKAVFIKIGQLGVVKSAALDAQGQLYVADGTSNTVKLFSELSPKAKLVKEFGEPGGIQPGPWNPMRMHPQSVAVQQLEDGSELIWVQGGTVPRRTTVWNTEGELVKDLIGTTHYKGTGGLMSDDIPTKGIVDGIIFDIDYETQSYTPVEIMGGGPPKVEGKHSLFYAKRPGNFANPYHFVSDVSGKEVEYYIHGSDFPKIFIRRGDRWHCVAAFSSKVVQHSFYGSFQWPDGFPEPSIKDKNDRSECFAWNDLNGDGYQQPNEVRWHKLPVVNNLYWFLGGWGFRPDDQLNWYFNGHVLRPIRFTEEGAPIYDLSKIERLPGALGQTQGEIYKTKSGYFNMPRHGHLARTFKGYDENGNLKWTYPNLWFGVHGGMTSPLGVPGNIVGMMKVTGIVDMGDWDYISIRGNYGQEFFLRSDGVYLGTAFIDNRMIPDEMPNEVIPSGTPISTTSMGEECFPGWTSRQRDGKVRLTSGYTNVHVYEITDLDTVRDIEPIQLTLSSQDVAACRAFEPIYDGVTDVTEITIARGKLAQPNTKAFEDAEVRIKAGQAENGRALLNYDSQNLYVSWFVIDATPMVNKGNSVELAFKSGDSVSLFVAPEGDYGSQVAGTRILLTEIQGKQQSVVYKPTSAQKAPFLFKSPVREHTYDYVKSDPRVKWGVQRQGGSYIVSAQVPWQVLGIRPKAGMELKLDVGIILGRNDTTTHVSQRSQWVDSQVNVVNDVPTESEFFPDRWGTATLGQ